MDPYKYECYDETDNIDFTKTRAPKQHMCDTRQNQSNKMAEYKKIIPNRRLTAKRGVFPYAIHTNVVSKPDNGFRRNPGVSNIPNENRTEFAKPFLCGKRNQTNVAPKTTNKSNNHQLINTSLRRNTFKEPAQSTPFVRNKPPYGISANFTNSSTTTEMNKNVLLNEYLTQQYNATVNNNVSNITEMKPINFNPEEAFQICTYQKIGEVINQSFIIRGSANFHSSLEVTSAIRKKIQDLYIERKTRDHSSSQVEDVEQPTKHESHAFQSVKKIQKSKRQDEPPSPNKGDIYEYDSYPDELTVPKFRSSRRKTSNHLLPEKDTLSRWKGNKNSLTKGNDNYLSPVCNFTETTNDWRSTITISSGSENDNSVSFPNNFSASNFRKNIRSEETVNSPSLFFIDDSPINHDKKFESRSQQAPANRFFSFDSVVAKRSIEPENEKLLNPIEYLKSTVGNSKTKKMRKKLIETPNPYYSDSTYYDVNRPAQNAKRKDTSHSKLKNHIGLRRNRFIFNKV